jgi:hypothetical protein
MNLVSTENNFYKLCSFNSIPKSTGFCGKLCDLFGLTIKAWDEKAKQEVYYSKNSLAKAIIGKNANSTQIDALANKILEAVNPFTRQTVTVSELEDCFDKIKQTGYEEAIDRLEMIKRDQFQQFTYDKNLSELGDILQPGDILARKYHETNPNPICKLQKFFRKPDYREAYKFSHIALYLGKLPDGKHWVAEASLPKENEPQIRRLQLNDERFQLKDKNQYLVIRNNNSEVADEAARLATLQTIEMLPKNEAISTVQDREDSLKYNHFDAMRSLWHSNRFDYFAKQRIFKYYSDYSNKIPYIYITDKRNLFCSQFAFLSIQMAEANKSEMFQEIIRDNPPPVNNGNGILNRISYVVRRAFWCRMMAIKYSKKMDQAFTTKVDFLRTSPQDAINYLLINNKNYQPVGMINKVKDIIN